jgi:TonB family protein
MSLQRKCLTASAITHGLVLVLFFVGSAFVPHKPKPLAGPEFQIFTLPPDFELVAQDNVFSGGNPDAAGGPKPQPLPQQPKKQETPAPIPQPEKPKPVPPAKVEPPPVKSVEPKPEPIKKEAVEKKPDPEAFDFSKLATKTVKLEPKKAEPIAFNDIKKQIKKVTVPADSKTPSASDKSKETKIAAANADALADIRKSLEGKLGSSSGPSGGRANVDDFLGPGGRRVASYSVYLAGIYRDAWTAPNKTSAPRAVRVRVTISKDGTVLSREVVDKSGDRDFIRAAENTVNRVKKFDRPPPTNEPSVTYTLEFIPPN